MHQTDQQLTGLDKQIIIEISDDGVITGVFCPSEDYEVNILDWGVKNLSLPEMRDYYHQLEKEKLKLTDCL
jgi:hypothetical protein